MKSLRSREFWKSLSLGVTGKWFLMAVLVGVIAGCGAIVFQCTGQFVVRFVLLEFSGFALGEGRGEKALFAPPDTQFSFPMLMVVLTLGGLASGIMVYTFAPEAEGHGTDGAIDAFHNRRGNIPLRVAIVKRIASAITLGTAGSGGREGPIAQIGAAFGSLIGRRLKLPARDRRILLAAGMGAGIGAIFRAPLAGAIFAAEILYRETDLEFDVVVAAAIASIIAYSVYGLFLPSELCFSHIFGGLSDYSTHSLMELLPYTVVAAALSAVAVIYIKAFYGIHNLFARLPGARHIRPAIGAAMAGLVAAALFYGFDQDHMVLAVLSTGYGTLQRGLESPVDVSLQMLLAVGFFKIVTTSLTIGSGGLGRSVWSVDGHWWLYWRGGWENLFMGLARTCESLGIRSRRNGRFLCRLCSRSNFHDHHGERNDGQLPVIVTHNVGIDAVLPALLKGIALPKTSGVSTGISCSPG